MKTGCFNLMKFKFAWTLSLFCMMFLACSGDKSSWNNTDTWTTSNEIGCFVTIKSVDQLAGFCVHYDLSSFALKPGYGWISVERKLPEYFDPNIPIIVVRGGSEKLNAVLFLKFFFTPMPQFPINPPFHSSVLL